MVVLFTRYPLMNIDDEYNSDLKKLLPNLNEQQRRLFLAFEAKRLGYGGVSKISKISDVSRVTITNGIKELQSLNIKPISAITETQDQRIRKAGAGRRNITAVQPGIKDALERIIDESTFGNPQSLLKWTTKSLRNLEEEMQRQGFYIKYRKIGYLLKEMGYSLQQNQKMNQVGKEHPDRDEQFRYISKRANVFVSAGLPVISIDCKKRKHRKL